MDHPCTESFKQSLFTFAFPNNRLRSVRKSLSTIVVEGTLSIDSMCGQADADILIAFHGSDWMNEMPIVKTDVAWLQPRGGGSWNQCAEWHRYQDGRLCWTRKDCWQRLFSNGVDAGSARNAAASLVKDVSVLLGYHFVADRIGLTEWPSRWPFWKHG